MSPEISGEYPLSAFRNGIINQLEKYYAEAVREKLAVNDDFASLEPEELRDLVAALTRVKSQQEFYDKLGESSKSGSSYYDLIFGPLVARARSMMDRAIEVLEEKKDQTGIDLGAGTGVFTPILASCCDNIVAVDLNRRLLFWAEQKLVELQQEHWFLNYKIVVGDILNLNYPDSSFDVAIGHGIITSLHPSQLPAFYQEVQRVLKPNGRYYRYNPPTDSGEGIYKKSYRGRMAGLIALIARKLSYTEFYEKGGNRQSVISARRLQGLSLTIHPFEDGLEGESIFRWKKHNP